MSEMGRPLKYTPETLYAKAREYFDNCEKNKLETSFGKKIPIPKTLSGLCLWLLVSKDYISEKAKDKNFSEVIGLIRVEVENDVEINSMLGFYNATIASKNLSANFNWAEKSEIKQTIQTINENDLID